MCRIILLSLQCSHQQHIRSAFCDCDNEINCGETEGLCGRCMAQWGGILPAGLGDMRVEMMEELRAQGIEDSGNSSGGGDPRLSSTSSGEGPVVILSGSLRQGGQHTGAMAQTSGTPTQEPVAEVTQSITQGETPRPREEWPLKMWSGGAPNGSKVQRDVAQGGGSQPPALDREQLTLQGKASHVKHAAPQAQPVDSAPQGAISQVMKVEEPKDGVFQEKKARRKSTTGCGATAPRRGKRAEETEAGAQGGSSTAQAEAPMTAKAGPPAEQPKRGGSQMHGRGSARGGSRAGSRTGSKADSTPTPGWASRAGGGAQGSRPATRAKVSTRGGAKAASRAGANTGSRPASRTSGTDKRKGDPTVGEETVEAPSKTGRRRPRG